MYCSNCGNKNEDNAKFCIQCGEKQNIIKDFKKDILLKDDSTLVADTKLHPELPQKKKNGIKKVVFFYALFNIVALGIYIVNLTPAQRTYQEQTDSNYVKHSKREVYFYLIPSYRELQNSTQILYSETKYFYPFHPFIISDVGIYEDSSNYNQKVISTTNFFVGFFGFYGFSEFLVYIILPIIIYLLFIVYKKVTK